MKASEVYDRQIRLWGVEAQKRMQAARVLFVGLRALQAEICKNVVLAGINVALLDHRPVSPGDLNSQFYLRPEDVGKNRAQACLPRVQEMNPLAKVECFTEDPATLPDGFFAQFDVVVASDLPPEQLLRIDAACRAAQPEPRAFIYADCFGFHGMALLDLGPAVEGVKDAPAASGGGGGGGEGKEQPAAPKTFTLAFPSLQEALSPDWQWSALAMRRAPVPRPFVMGRLLQLYESQHNGARPAFPLDDDKQHAADAAAFVALAQQAMESNGLGKGFLSEAELRTLAANATAELSPVCAVVGGILGQEILKAVSRKGEPALNCFVWDGDSHEGRVLRLPPASAPAAAAPAVAAVACE